jgi:hypothetical protein
MSNKSLFWFCILILISSSLSLFMSFQRRHEINTLQTYISTVESNHNKTVESYIMEVDSLKSINKELISKLNIAH